MSSARKLVAVVVPMSTRAELTASEELSLRHLQRFLSPYDKYLIAPEGLSIERSGFQPMFFAREFFGSVAAHTRLMLSREFYRAFEGYEFILLHHLDALVFADQLQEWCAMDYDFVGPPWLQSADAPELGFSQVGNGGLSLRRVSSFLRVIQSSRYKLDPDEYWKKYHAAKPWHLRLINSPRRYLKYLGVRNGVGWEIANFAGNEDCFWSKRAQHYDPSFRIAPVEVALRFAFECAPRHCFEMNGNNLPFGCHAWERYDREFWQPFLLT